MKKIIRRVSWYPPYMGAGIRLKKVNPDFTRFEVELKMRFFNRNIFGTHFGGSLYAMSDPFYVFIIMNYLGNGYIVWDKSAKIEFLKPGKGKITGIFEISVEELQKLKSDVDLVTKKTIVFKTELKNESGQPIASIEKEIYIRKK